MCAMFPIFRKDRDAEAAVPEPQLSFDAAARDWFVQAPCDDCGGYRMGLQVNDPAQRELAGNRAAAFLSRVHARGGCLGCASRRWREGEAPDSSQPHVWWDTDTGQWMAWRVLPGAEQGVSLPLGIESFWSPQEVRAAARALWSSQPLPLRVACDRSGLDPEAPTTFYDAESGCWRLHVPCFDCGGFELRLTSFGRGAVEAACDEALSCLSLLGREGCPQCRTQLERSLERAEGEPRIWFDTEVRDWLLWQPLEDGGEGVTLPLGIGRFDARRTLVYKAAANLLFDSHQFLD